MADFLAVALAMIGLLCAAEIVLYATRKRR